MPGESVVFFDLVGVVTPKNVKGTWPDSVLRPMPRMKINAGKKVWVSQEMVNQICALPSWLVWTNHDRLASFSLHPMFRRIPTLPSWAHRRWVNRDKRGSIGWWKADIILDWLSEHEEIRRIVWIDYAFDSRFSGRKGRALRLRILNALNAKGQVELMLVKPYPELQPEDLAEINEFLTAPIPRRVRKTPSRAKEEMAA